MGSGSLRELYLLKKIAFGGVYVTDPVVPTFWGPQLTATGQKCATVAGLHNKMQFYKGRMQSGMYSGTLSFYTYIHSYAS